MKKLLLILVFISPFYSIWAMHYEYELAQLRLGMPVEEVISIYGEPYYSKYDKENKTRGVLYYFYKNEGGLARYHIYFQDDTLVSLKKFEKKEEIRQVADEDGSFRKFDSYDKDVQYSIEGRGIIVTKIFEGIPLSNEQIYDALLTGIARACNGSQGEFKMKEPNHIVYHGIIDKVITFDGRWGSINVFYTIDAAIKQGRFRVKVIGEEIDWHQDNDKETYYFPDIYPFGDGAMREIKIDESQEFINNSLRYFRQYITVIEEEMQNRTNDDW